MSKLVKEIPATELIERAQTMARIVSTNDEVRAWGALNDVYLQWLPAQADWNFLLASSSLTTTAKYATGTATVNTGATAVTFGGGAVIPAGLDQGRLKFNDNPNVYTFTRTSSSDGTIAPALSEDRNISAGAFTLTLPIYTLPTNFNRFPKNGGLQMWQGGRPTPISEEAIQSYYADITVGPTRPARCRLVAPDTAGAARVELDPPPDKAYVIPFDYFADQPPLRESTGGVATVAASATGATFQGAVRLGEVTSGWFFRIDNFGTDANSEWHRVIGVSAANSNVIFQSTFTTSAANSANYTLCPAPQVPALLHTAVLYGVVKHLLADQNDKTFIYVDSLQSSVVYDAKRLYKTRIYNQDIETALEDYHFRR